MEAWQNFDSGLRCYRTMPHRICPSAYHRLVAQLRLPKLSIHTNNLRTNFEVESWRFMLVQTVNIWNAFQLPFSPVPTI
uniref:Uncharacterized protein n=1 Tax=Pararge aegeria TaxID=116150 RepID=S4NH70_9NEOP